MPENRRSSHSSPIFHRGLVQSPLLLYKGLDATDELTEAEDCDSTSQIRRIRFRLLQEPLFVDHIDPAVVSRFDTRSSRPCEFCRELDPQFPERRPLDQMVASSRKAIASAHLTEDGYVRHRMLELRRITSRAPLTAA